MDWANERYVRVYTRDTADDLVLSWQAMGLWPQLLRKADRSGVIATKHGPRGIAALVRWPLEIVEPALAELLEDGRIKACTEPVGYVIPNYLEAQETPSSDAQRKRDERERRGALAHNSVTKRDDGSRNVTKSHERSRTVTPSHSVPIRTVPDRAVPNQEREVAPPGGGPVLALVLDKPRAKPKRTEPTYTDAELADVALVLSKLSDRNGAAYQRSKEHTALIVGRLRAGFTAWDLRRVIAYCADELGWQDKPEMKPYLRPETLFGPKTMEKYVYQARAWMPQDAPTEAANDDRGMTGPRWEEPPWMTSTTTSAS